MDSSESQRPAPAAPDAPATTGAADPGDAEGVRGIWRRHRRWVAAVLLAHMPRDAELDDLLQEVAVLVLRKGAEIRDPRLVRPWLRVVAMNVARTAARRRSVRLRLVRPAPEDFDSMPASAPPSDADQREQADRALQYARELHPDYSEPLLMRCVRGMTYKQIAEALDLPVTTIETRLARARRMLKERLEHEDGASTPPLSATASNTANSRAGGVFS